MVGVDRTGGSGSFVGVPKTGFSGTGCSVLACGAGAASDVGWILGCGGSGDAGGGAGGKGVVAGGLIGAGAGGGVTMCAGGAGAAGVGMLVGVCGMNSCGVGSDGTSASVPCAGIVGAGQPPSSCCAVVSEIPEGATEKGVVGTGASDTVGFSVGVGTGSFRLGNGAGVGRFDACSQISGKSSEGNPALARESLVD